LGLTDLGEPKPGSRAETIGPTDLACLVEIIDQFGLRLVGEITVPDWDGFLDKRHAANDPDTRARYCNPIITFLEWCAAPDRGYLQSVPALKKRPEGAKPQKSWKRSKRREVADLRGDLLVFMFERASPHLKGQLYAEWSTGARVSSVLFGCKLSDLVLTEH